MSENTQYIIVAAIIAAALIWTAIRTARSKGKKGPDCGCGCNGCSLHDKCARPEAKSHKTFK